MALEQTMTAQAKAQALGALTEGVIKLALYTAAADLGPSTQVYTTAGEVTGAGYVAGGRTVSNITVNVSGDVAYVSFDNVTWTPANFTARGALIYNASLGDLAIAVLDFGADKTATTSFTVQIPANTATSALIRLT